MQSLGFLISRGYPNSQDMKQTRKLLLWQLCRRSLLKLWIMLVNPSIAVAISFPKEFLSLCRSQKNRIWQFLKIVRITCMVGSCLPKETSLWRTWTCARSQTLLENVLVLQRWFLLAKDSRSPLWKTWDVRWQLNLGFSLQDIFASICLG